MSADPSRSPEVGSTVAAGPALVSCFPPIWTWSRSVLLLPTANRGTKKSWLDKIASQISPSLRTPDTHAAIVACIAKTCKERYRKYQTQEEKRRDFAEFMWKGPEPDKADDLRCELWEDSLPPLYEPLPLSGEQCCVVVAAIWQYRLRPSGMNAASLYDEVQAALARDLDGEWYPGCGSAPPSWVATSYFRQVVASCAGPGKMPRRTQALCTWPA